MDSWRDSASQQVDDDFQALMNLCMPWVEKALGRYRVLAPFGGSIGIDDSEHFEAAAAGESTLEMLELLHENARRQKYVLRAAAFVVDARLPEQGGQDVLVVHLEHVEGTVLQVVTPYRRKRLLHRVWFEESEVAITDPVVWF